MDLIAKRPEPRVSRAELMATAARRYLPNCALGLPEGDEPAAPQGLTDDLGAQASDRRALFDSLVTESNRVTVLGHLHPRHLRKEYGE